MHLLEIHHQLVAVGRSGLIEFAATGEFAGQCQRVAQQVVQGRGGNLRHGLGGLLRDFNAALSIDVASRANENRKRQHDHQDKQVDPRPDRHAGCGLSHALFLGGQWPQVYFIPDWQ